MAPLHTLFSVLRSLFSLSLAFSLALLALPWQSSKDLKRRLKSLQTISLRIEEKKDEDEKERKGVEGVGRKEGTLAISKVLSENLLNKFNPPE